jgi:SSS family solute:Na+ symporter
MVGAMQAMFVNIPFMHQMMLTCIGTILVIAGISKLEGNQDDPKGIVLSKQLFATNKTFNVAAFWSAADYCASVCVVLVGVRNNF